MSRMVEINLYRHIFPIFDTDASVLVTGSNLTEVGRLQCAFRLMGSKTIMLDGAYNAWLGQLSRNSAPGRC